MHSDGPAGLDDPFPDSRQDDFTARAEQVVAAFLHERANDLNVEEGLFDEVFHALRGGLVGERKGEGGALVSLPAMSGRVGRGS